MMDRRTVLKAGLVLAAASHTAVAVAERNDEMLVRLGSDFDFAFANENAARVVGQETGNWSAWDAAFERTRDIVRQIEDIPPTTLEGLRVKARCIQWCHGNDPIEIGEGNSTDVRFTMQIINSLLKA